jgi:hypothetical protein
MASNGATGCSNFDDDLFLAQGDKLSAGGVVASYVRLCQRKV